MNRYTNPTESFVPMAIGLTLAIAIHLLMLPAAIVAMQRTAVDQTSSASAAMRGSSKGKTSAAPASPKVSQPVQEHAQRPAAISPTPRASADHPSAISLKKKSPPKLRLGSRNGDPYAATAAWISYEDFQKLQAPKGRQEQPALQKEAYPTPGAPYRPDSPASSVAGGNIAGGHMGSSARSGQKPSTDSLLYPLNPSAAGLSNAHANTTRSMPSVERGEPIVTWPLSDMTAARPQRSPFPPLTSDSAKSSGNTNSSSSARSGSTPASLRSNNLPAESVPGQTSQAHGQVLLTPNPGSSTTPSNSLSPSSSSSVSSENAKPDSPSPDASSSNDRRPASVPAGAAAGKEATSREMKGAADAGGNAGGNVGANVRGASASPKADKESYPVSLHEGPVLIRPGHVITGRGIEIKTSVPRLSVVARFVLPTNPIIKVTFDSHGDVVHARFIRTSGYENWDGPVLASLYRWKAQGPLLDELKGGFELEVELLFSDSSPP